MVQLWDIINRNYYVILSFACKALLIFVHVSSITITKSADGEHAMDIPIEWYNYKLDMYNYGFIILSCIYHTVAIMSLN